MRGGADVDCRLCHGTEKLTAYGIFMIYLRPGIAAVSLLTVSLVCAAVWSAGFLAVSAVSALLPLVRADLRPYLFLPVLTGKFLGREVNCPKCNPYGPVFRAGSK